VQGLARRITPPTVLDAAATCFRRNGFRGASMSDISTLAGMSTGHIYHYFKSKEAIVEAIVERDLQHGLAYIETIKKADNIVQAVIDVATDCIIDRGHMSEPALFMEILAEASRNPTVAVIMNNCKNAVRRSLLDALEIGRKQGSVAADADVDVACTMLMLIFDGVTVPEHAQSPVPSRRDHAADGLAARPRPASAPRPGLLRVTRARTRRHPQGGRSNQATLR